MNRIKSTVMILSMTISILALVFVSSCGNAGAGAVNKVSDQEEALWLRWVIPLPKQISIDEKAEVALSDVKIRVLEGTGKLGKNAAAKLVELFKEKADIDPNKGRFEIVIGICDEKGQIDGITLPEASRLASLPNSEQAHCISPAGENRLVLTALNERGVFYAVATLRQLLQSKFDGDKVMIPLVKVVDWPDLAERGEWGWTVDRDIEWMAEYKMNLCEKHCKSIKVTPEGKGVAEFDKTLIRRGAKCAVKVVPIITHLDLLQRTDLFKVFPDTLGVCDPNKWYGHLPACFSKPQTVQVLADWMVSLAEQPETTDINIWLSEQSVACQCEQCKKKGQFVLEAEAIAKGFELAKKVRPDIDLRVLLTQGSYAFNDQVIDTLPKEIGITYYHGSYTYDSSRKEMIYPLLEEYAAKGGWLGCYPQLTASWRIVCPWSGPQFIRFRMNEFVDDGLQCLCGYATPDNRFYEFNVIAAAEWSWNAKGRDEQEFALAYFTKKGVSDPQKAADWAVMMGPVGWDVYGARVPYSWFFGATTKLFKTGKLPALGDGPFVYMPDEEYIKKDLEICATAKKLAKEVGDKSMIAETQVIEGYVKMLKSIHELRNVIGKKKALTDDEKKTAGHLMAELDQATHQTADGLKTWQLTIMPDPNWVKDIGKMAKRFEDTVRVTRETGDDICKFMRTLGVK